MTVTVTPKITTGSVKGKDGGRAIGSKRIAGGKAVFMVKLKPGTNKLTFTYAKADNFAPTSVKLTMKYTKPKPKKKHHKHHKRH